MFEKLTPRERKLAWSASLILPVSILFIGIFWFIGKYDANRNQIIALDSQLEAEEERAQSAMKAEKRRSYYNSISMSHEINDATQAYQTWLKLLCEEVGLDLATAKPNDASAVKFERKEVGGRRTFSVMASGNLAQLTQFLTRFYEIDALHRINKLRIVPQNETTTKGSAQKIRTGKLSINMNIELLGLATADAGRDFSDQPRQLARSSEEYQNTILRRNIFGPANNTPTLSARTRSPYESGKEVTVNLTAKDADENDLLTFELIDPPLEGIEIEHEPGERSASIVIPGQAEGPLNFKLKVVDNGFPAKDSTEEISINFQDAEVIPDTPDPPPFKHATQTRVTGISLGKDGKWMAWITVRTTKDNYKLIEGESFTLDDQEWVVETIKPTEVILRVGDTFLVGRPNALERGILKEINNPNATIKTNVPVGKAPDRAEDVTESVSGDAESN